jgi:integrase
VTPSRSRSSETLKLKLAAENSKTFDTCRDKFIEARSVAWRNGKHHQQWVNTLNTYCSPILGQLAIKDVDVAHVLKVLEPIWVAKSETANRVRGRIEAILDWARTLGYRQGDNPARWRGHLENLLPPRKKFRRVKHHSSLSYHDLPGFMEDLRNRPGYSARALEFAILCGARTGEVLGAVWGEISLDRAIWSIPAERMNDEKEFALPAELPELVTILPDLREAAAHGAYMGHEGFAQASMDMRLRACAKRGRNLWEIP